MLKGNNVVAIVLARSGSKGIPGKNMKQLSGTSLIGWTGICLSHLSWLDGKIISTDSEVFAEEGRKYGMDAPFLRPADISTDTASAVDTTIHAFLEAERFYSKNFDIGLIVDPTSPLRLPEDIEGATDLLINANADSVVCVSPLNSKWHPAKALSVADGKLGYYEDRGETVVARQSLETLYWRNGACYALSRDCLINKKKIITGNTLPYIIERDLMNIDYPIELEFAELLMKNNNYKFMDKGEDEKN
jgi:CMP-N-acetylneuraminic acid synthetase